MWIGLAVVAGSVLLGARVLAVADDTVTVWTAGRDLGAGSRLTAGDLRSSHIRFGSADLAARYVSAESVPEGAVLVHQLAAGELLPRSALGTDQVVELAELPIAVSTEAVPAGLRAGELVDVWVTPGGPGQEEAPAQRILVGARVLAVPEDASALGPSATRQVLVGVPAEADDQLGQAIGQLSRGTTLLVRRS